MHRPPVVVRIQSALLAFALVPLAMGAAFEPLEFASPELERRYRVLTAELRCLVCQNQNLADSDADLAGDLRRQVHEMLQRGETDAAIVDYMVQRYGEFVLYKPPLRPATALLWGAPLLLGAGGLALLAYLLRRRATSAGPAGALSEHERERLDSLLKESRAELSGVQPNAESPGSPIEPTSKQFE
ncbi:MAG: cytochrome c-type biogenesis protein [Gammaproteobacteria bacterium]